MKATLLLNHKYNDTLVVFIGPLRPEANKTLIISGPGTEFAFEANLSSPLPCVLAVL